ncbi:MAG: VOC family protein [Suipraeoptans sp.]
MYKRIGHVAIRVTDMEKALCFYCDGLGFKRKFALQDDKQRPWIEYLEIGPYFFVELFYDNEKREAIKQDPERLGYLHLSIEVNNLKEYKKQIEKSGITFDGEIKMQTDNSWQLWATDPDGNRIEIMEYTQQSKQIQ